MDRFFLSGSIAKMLGVKNEERRSVSTSEMLAEMMRAAQIEDRPGVDVMTHAIHSAIDSACLIVGADPESGDNWVGSGFLVEGGLIITVAHVLPKGDSTVKVSFDGNHFFDAIAVTRNDDYDVGSLKLVDEIGIKPAKLAAKDKELLLGEQIAVIGSPEGWENVVTVGRISAVGRTPKIMPDSSWQDLIFIDADILEGSSGSMVIDAEGEVVGMVMGLIGQHAQDLGKGSRAVIPTPRIFEALIPEGGGVPQGKRTAAKKWVEKDPGCEALSEYMRNHKDVDNEAFWEFVNVENMCGCDSGELGDIPMEEIERLADKFRRLSERKKKNLFDRAEVYS